MKKRADNESAIIREAQLEIEAKELAVIEAKRQRKFDAKIECIKIGEEAENEKRRKDEELREINKWETIQRFKRDEFNKEFLIQERKRNWEKKMATAKDLRKQMVSFYFMINRVLLIH